jgi:tripeptide aminopeptidase
VPEFCELVAEVRSLDDERAGTVTTQLIDHLQNAADAGECDLDLNVQSMFQGYRHKPRAPQLAVAERALAACGHTPERIVSGGASGERVTEQALEDMLDVALTVVEESAAELAGVPAGRPEG